MIGQQLVGTPDALNERLSELIGRPVAGWEDEPRLKMSALKTLEKARNQVLQGVLDCDNF
jgi:hypothetical protein